MVSIMKQTRDCIENRSMVRLESPVQLFLLVVYIIVLSTTELREFLTNLRMLFECEFSGVRINEDCTVVG